MYLTIKEFVGKNMQKQHGFLLKYLQELL